MIIIYGVFFVGFRFFHVCGIHMSTRFKFQLNRIICWGWTCGSGKDENKFGRFTIQNIARDIVLFINLMIVTLHSQNEIREAKNRET